jgi:hypothetical protein
MHADSAQLAQTRTLDSRFGTGECSHHDLPRSGVWHIQEDGIAENTGGHAPYVAGRWKLPCRVKIATTQQLFRLSFIAY